MCCLSSSIELKSYDQFREPDEDMWIPPLLPTTHAVYRGSYTGATSWSREEDSEQFAFVPLPRYQYIYS